MTITQSITLFTLTGACFMSFSYANNLTVTIDNIEPSRAGVIRVYLFGAEGFPKHHQQALQQYELEPKSRVSIQFTQVPEHFAIKAFHDENNSNSLTKNWTGLFPAEGLAFSNGATVRFGPPSFSQAKLSYSQTSGNIQLKMLYP